MKIDLDKIMPIEQLIRDTSSAINEVKNKKQLFIFENNMPEYVLLTQDQYEKLLSSNKHRGHYSLTTAEIVELLNGIGKKVYVDHYYELKNGELLNSDYTLASKRSRIAKARKIFKSNNQLKALKLIIESDRLEDEIIAKAQQIYIIESKSNTASPHAHTKKHIKIGRLARTTISKLLFNEKLSEYQVNNLQSLEYSKQKLNLNFPLLKKVVKEISIKQQCKDNNGYGRYYKQPATYKGEQYLICSQWFEELHRDKLTSFLKQFEEMKNE